MCDTLLAPEPALPAVRDTDTALALDRWLARAPRANRIGLRALLYAAELAPRLLGPGKRLRRLAEPQRAEALRRAERSRARALVRPVQGLAAFCYYGDDRVMLALGYDAEANVTRARRLRASEGRP